MQWHPLFASLLRSLLGDYYEVSTNVPVGDLPREADLVVVRRKTAKRSSFRSLWRHLTTWNMMEFKGATVSPRIDHLDRLVEVGLGVARRLNEERTKKGQVVVRNRQISFWYFANRLGKRILNSLQQRLTLWDEVDQGVWRSEVIGYPLYFISGIDSALDEESLPLHVIGKEPAVQERATAQFVASNPVLWEMYSQWLFILHYEAWREAIMKAQAELELEGGYKIHLDFDEIADYIGEENFAKQLGMERLRKLISIMNPEEKRELFEHLKESVNE